ncbi:uncharacterized protein LOC111356074 [Spodoptera litura]|uniref:Uncharacterized protein LOC111356074 n=1 Tax=Spodoptera litura TaxID=69820 RepID=A0A9J7E7Z5_SPOLT|nr:uncharacterized protein LOC111356074 [Spodoptera litura]
MDGLPIKERYKTVKSYEESDAEIIIMENVAKKGFKTGHRMDVVSLEFAKMAIEELAKFHALSFVLKAKRPDFFEDQVKIRKIPYKTGEKWHKLAQNIINITLDNIDEGIKKRVEKFCDNIGERFTVCFENESVRNLCHGDYRANNILVKIVDGKISELIPVDYQMMYLLWMSCSGLPIFHHVLY